LKVMEKEEYDKREREMNINVKKHRWFFWYTRKCVRT
jgi:hypothetical protein